MGTSSQSARASYLRIPLLARCPRCWKLVKTNVSRVLLQHTDFSGAECDGTDKPATMDGLAAVFERGERK